MGSKYTKQYTEEFKRDAIALVDSSGKTVTAVARELSISSESLCGWYRKAKAAAADVSRARRPLVSEAPHRLICHLPVTAPMSGVPYERGPGCGYLTR
ncbi:transposase [Streptomyces sp. ME18-1-4]|uniref:transposase n=1 Tax=Streptomyces sp. ME18-1-4 TaxID=3028685 RepID=UPI0029B7E54F|nr:transposase [Streptomyces sp. ME18-1-4]MDX3246503.1 transposase [Streptomyces sp. ME18-1-4]